MAQAVREPAKSVRERLRPLLAGLAAAKRIREVPVQREAQVFGRRVDGEVQLLRRARTLRRQRPGPLQLRQVRYAPNYEISVNVRYIWGKFGL